MKLTNWSMCLSFGLLMAWARGLEAQQGQLTSITVVPSPPVLVGKGDTNTANDDGIPPINYAWDWRCLPNGNWVTDPRATGPSLKSVYMLEQWVGTWETRCTGTYQGMGQPRTSVVTTQTQVLGPDNDIITSGLNNTNSTGFPVMSVTIRFRLRRGSNPIGMTLADPIPGEQIIRGGSGSWIWQSAPGVFYLQANSDGAGGTIDIVDVKVMDVGQSQLSLDRWNNTPLGAVVDDFYQTNGVKIRDCHGNHQTFTFVQRHFQRIKTGTQTVAL